ncbi:MAG: ThiF family adenylyltransferase [Endomicrobiia bacterium]|nr:ThiF family adenylyltransferase [Endomicrobiia bacterium]
MNVNNLTFEKRLEFTPPRIGRIVVIGCGGTGGYMAQTVSRLLYHYKRHGREIGLTLADFDAVEDKNVGRQNFCAAELGVNKAEALARRFSRAYGIEIEVISEMLAQKSRWLSRAARENITLVIGAVDNAYARKAIAESLSCCERTSWLDCGNERDCGQVLLGTSAPLTKKMLRLGQSLGALAALPLPSRVHPELVDTRIKKKGVSCAQAATADAQGIIINQAVASVAGQYVYELLEGFAIDKFATYISLRPGSAKSLYTTTTELAKYAGRDTANANAAA